MQTSQSTVQTGFWLQSADSENLRGGGFASRRLSFPKQMTGASDDGAVAPHPAGGGEGSCAPPTGSADGCACCAGGGRAGEGTGLRLSRDHRNVVHVAYQIVAVHLACRRVPYVALSVQKAPHREARKAPPSPLKTVPAPISSRTGILPGPLKMQVVP